MRKVAMARKKKKTSGLQKFVVVFATFSALSGLLCVMRESKGAASTLSTAVAEHTPLLEDVILAEGGGSSRRLEMTQHPDQESVMKANTVLVLALGIVALSVGFEHARDVLFKLTPKTMHPILLTMFSELTLLGFIGMLLFITEEFALFDGLSLTIFDDADAITECAEDVHMTLFLIMVMYLGVVVALVRLGYGIKETWKRYEQEDIADGTLLVNRLAEEMAVLQELTGPKQKVATRMFTEPLNVNERYQIFEYAAMRKKFVNVWDYKSNKTLDPNFDFATYLYLVMGENMAEIVEIPATAWASLAVLLCFLTLAFKFLYWDYRLGVLISFGFGLPFFLYSIVVKMHDVKRLCLDAEMMGHLRHIALERVADAAASQGSTVKTAGEAVFSILGPLLEGEPAPIYPEGVSPPAVGGGVAGGGPSAPDAEKGNAESEEEEDDYHEKRFWFGELCGMELTLNLMRLCILVTAVYEGILFILFYDLLLATGVGTWAGVNGLSPIGCIIVSIVGMVPIMLIVVVAEKAIADYTMVSCVETMRNDQLMDKVQGMQATARCFSALKVICGLKKAPAEEGPRGGREPPPSLSSIDKAYAGELFSRIDMDHSGAISAEELKEFVVILAIDEQAAAARMAHMFDVAGGEEAGMVDYEEFVHLVQTFCRGEDADDKDVVAAFMRNISGGDGRGLSKADFVAALHKLMGIKPSTSVSDELYDYALSQSTAGAGKSSKVDVEEFLAMLNYNAPPGSSGGPKEKGKTLSADATQIMHKSLAMVRMAAKLQGELHPTLESHEHIKAELNHRRQLQKEKVARLPPGSAPKGPSSLAANLKRRDILHGVFSLFDTDGEGSISGDEVREFLVRVGIGEGDPEELTRIVNSLDEDGSGEVTFDEFMEYIEKNSNDDAEGDELYEMMFSAVDTSGDGEISVQELAQALRALGQVMTVDDIMTITQDVDTDGTGSVDQGEFVELMKSLDV